MFELELGNAKAMLEEYRPKVKKDAGAKVPCAELTISCPLDSDVLAFFSPELRDQVFDDDTPADMAGGPSIRDPGMVFPIARAEKMSGATVSIHLGIGEPMVLEECTLDTFRLTPVSGGPVIVVFRVLCRPSESQAGRLYMLQEQPIEITVDPAELSTMPEAA